MPKLRILHVANIGHVKHSGVAVVVPNYLKYQSPHANIALLNLQDIKPMGSRKLYQTFLLSEMKNIDEINREFKPDLVVFHEVYRPAYAKIARQLVKKNIPYIITPHVSLTKAAQDHKRLKKSIGNMLIFNDFIKSAVAIHYLSEAEKIQSELIWNLNSFVCGNGIELKGRQKKQFSKNDLKLIYVGRFEIRIKGIDRILEIVNIAQDQMRIRNIHITLRGYDEAANVSWIKKMIGKYQISDLVSVGGPLFGKEKVHEILQHDAFLQLSRTEGQPLAIMEALDLGMPCIVTEGTTFLEPVSSHGAGLVVSDDPHQAAKSIIDFRDKHLNELMNMSKRASEYAKNEFDWHMVSYRMIECYTEVLKEAD